MPDVVSTEIDVSFAPKQARCVHTVEIDGEAVLLDESVNRLHLLNSTFRDRHRTFDRHGRYCCYFQCCCDRRYNTLHVHVDRGRR